MTIIASYFSVSLIARAIYIVVIAPNAKRLGRIYYDDYLSEALWCSVLAYSALLLGFGSQWTAKLVIKLPKRELTWPRSVPAFRIALFATLGFAVTVYFLRSGASVVGGGGHGDPASGNVVSGFLVIATSAIPTAWIASYIYFLDDAKAVNKVKALPLVLMSLLYIAASIGASGGKQAFFQPLMEGLIVFHYVRKRLRLWQLAIVSVPAIVLAFGLINFYRFVIVGTGGSPKSFADVVNMGGEAIDAFGSRSTGGQASVFDQMMNRQAGIDALAVVIKYTPNPQPFALGGPWVKAVINAVVPRQLWKDKPIISPGYDFEQKYLGMPGNYDGHTSMQVVADLYANSWLVGVAAAMLLLGIVLKAFYEFCSPTPGRPGGVYMYAALIPIVGHYMQSTVAADLIQFPRIVAFTVLGALFFGVRLLKQGREGWWFLPAGGARPVPVVPITQ
jgi:hypothetical protein